MGRSVRGAIAALAFVVHGAGGPAAFADDAYDAKIITVPTPMGAASTIQRAPSRASHPPASLTTPIGIQNGDFSLGLLGWTLDESGGSTTPGTVEVVNEEAVFSEGDSFLVSLRQTFIVPPNTIELTFDFRDVPGFDQTDVFIPDAFEASLLDASFHSVVPTWDTLATSFFNMQETGAILQASGVTLNGTIVSVDVSSLAAGSEVSIFFDLIGGDGDLATSVTLDSVALVADGCNVFAEHTEYGTGWPGTLGVPQVTVVTEPLLGSVLQLDVSNSYGQPTTAIGILSLAPDAMATPVGGTLLVSVLPGDLIGIWTFPLPGSTGSIGHQVGNIIDLCGVSFFGQVIVFDPGATDNYAFSAGISFVLGS